MYFPKKLTVGVLAGMVISSGSLLHANGSANDNANENGIENSSKNAKEDVPENVIVMVGDGMGMGQMEIASLLEHGKKGELFMESLEHTGMTSTYSADNNVTDSAAAGTAIATGTKTNNGSIGVDEDGNEVDSILDQYQDDGKKVGVISNNTVTDATPASFTASVADRGSEEDIAEQQYEEKYDVLLGGGGEFFGADEDESEDRLVDEFQESGYEYATTEEELEEAGTPDRLLGLFNDSYMNYKTDKDDVDSEEPSLQSMTETGLDVLSQDDDGFFMMVEGARIDHAAHAADATGVWQEMIEFDQTVEQVVTWAEDRDDTLVVVLSDHETLGMSATETMDVDGLKDIEVSPEYMAQQLETREDSDEYTDESIQQVFSEYADIDITNEELEAFRANIEDDAGEVYPEYQVGWEIGSIIADHYSVGALDTEIRAESDTGGHTGEMVPVFAAGAGSDHFSGYMDNTDIKGLIEEASSEQTNPGKENGRGHGNN
ncbi:alkaline phosphatase [Marinococcus sp. PL1-022]|uniref:alkaline phosphatase n=1 Tax=Marinococcus sp. PL1-022 TaxID=3095363 RepID=UPI0029C58D00|nr:alkaline phosphatase [Marinococcus sp. PL1-022]MDX6151833.1 alkaline phosphatase [Marinococcus sp. PL1-022]